MPVPETRDFLDYGTTRKKVFDNVLGAVKASFPVENARYRVDILDPSYDDDTEFTKADEKKAILSRSSLARKLSGTWRLTDKTTGDVLDESRRTLCHVPYLTDRGVYINRGSEMVVNNQMRLLSGVFARKKDNGEYESHFNILKGGPSFRVFMEPATGVFKLQAGQSKIGLFPILKAMGLTDGELQKIWGNEVFAANARGKDTGIEVKKAIAKLGSFRTKEEMGEAEPKSMREVMEKLELDPRVTQTTLGKPYSRVTPEVFMAATRKLLDIAAGKAETDDRDSLAYQELHSAEDLFPERFSKDAGNLAKRILQKASMTHNLKHVYAGIMNQHIDSVLYRSGLAQNLEETNPIDVLDQNMKVTRLGEGGIPGRESVPMEARAVQPSHFTYVDAIKTPESGSAGVDTRIASAALKGADKKLYAPLINLKTGKTEIIPPDVAATKTVAFPGELKQARLEGRPMKAMRGGKMVFVKPSEVDYEAPSAQGMFTQTSNLIPLFGAMKGQRLSMGSRMLSQAMALMDAEAQFVQGGDPTGKSYAAQAGKHMGAIFSDQGGTVTDVTGDSITVRGPDGKKKTHELYINLPYNRQSFLHNTPVVKVGDTVRPGGILARSNFTDAKGTMALGKNLRVAYLPYQGKTRHNHVVNELGTEDDEQGVGSVTGDTPVLWYDQNNHPHFTNIADVTDIREAFALTSSSTGMVKIPVRQLVAHASSEPLLKLKFASGRVLKATACHSFVTVSETGELIESRADALIPGRSFIPRARELELPTVHHDIHCVSKSGKTLDAILDSQLGFILGMYAAEGSVGYTQDSNKAYKLEGLQRIAHHIVFAVTDAQLRPHLHATLNSAFPDLQVSDKPGNPYISVYSAALASWIDQNCGAGSFNKRVPDVIFGASRDTRLGFLAGFWCGDGRVSTAGKQGQGAVDIDTLITSRQLRDGLGLLCASLGISTTHGEYDPSKPGYGRVYRLGIAGEDLVKFPDLPRSDKGPALRLARESYTQAEQSDLLPVPITLNPRKVTGCCPCKAYSTLNAARVKGCTRRSTALKYIPDATSDIAAAGVLKLANNQALVWDKLVSSELLGVSSDPVYDLDMAPVGTFMCLDTLVVHNSNFEDAVVISESAAKKLTSEKMYTHSLESTRFSEPSKNKYISMYPSKYTTAQLKTVGDNGVVKPGTVLAEGDPLILAVEQRTSKGAGMLHRAGKSSFNDASVVWDHHFPGVVTDVFKDDEGTKVAIKGSAPCEQADKLSNLFGGKGVISAIIPDDQMLKGEDGKPFDIVMNPLGVISRNNPSQMYEALLGKVARKTGKSYVLPPFSAGDLSKYVKDELTKADLKDTESVYDPVRKRKLPNIFTGEAYILKLRHTAASKGSERGLGSYTAEGEPARGQGQDESNPKRIGELEMKALISHNVPQVISDIKLIRGQRNEDYWRNVIQGRVPPAPGIPNAYRKFLTLLQGAGINFKQRGDALQLLAMTDKDVDKLSSGEIKNPETVRWHAEFGRGALGEKSMDPIEGGLFDRGLTGAHGGSKWSHIQLTEPMPSPVMEEPIRRLLGLTQKEFEGVISGTHDLGEHGTGTQALKKALSAINIDRELANQKALAYSKRGTSRDLSIKRLKYLTALKDTGVSPADLMVTKVPVIPPIFRPVTATEKFDIVSSPNALYRSLMFANSNYQKISQSLEGEPVGKARLNLYNAFKAVTGLGDPISKELVQQNVSGLLSSIKGDSPKHSLLQRKLLGTSVDTAGRAVLVPNASLDIDQVGIPEKMAWEIYTPFVVNRLVREMGGIHNVAAAIKMVEDRAPRAREALHKELETRPVLSSRAPVLHKFGIMAFKPVLTKSKAMQLSPPVFPVFGADSDGDVMSLHVLISPASIKEAMDKMLPSRILRSPADHTPLWQPRQEFLDGLYRASVAKSDKPPRIFRSKADVIAAFNRGELELDDKIVIADVTKKSDSK